MLRLLFIGDADDAEAVMDCLRQQSIDVEAEVAPDEARAMRTLAHEFNNVLMGITPFIEIIRRTSSRERIDKALAEITAAVKRGKKLTAGILRASRDDETP